MAHVGIIGAGIAGLTVGFYGRQNGHTVQLFEASNRAGGLIRSEWRDGYLVEHGPNLLRPRPQVLSETIRALSLDDEIVTPEENIAARYVVRDGVPTPLPRSLWSLITSGLFSTTAKLRLLAEPFISASSSENESVASFARRRLGTESLEYAVNPLVGGTFAGDPEVLSMRHTFQTLYDREREHGSLLTGALQASPASSNGRDRSNIPEGPFSFRGGLETLPRGIAATLDQHIQYNARVTSVSRSDRGYCVTVDRNGTNEHSAFDAVVCTTPLHALPALELDSSVDCSFLSDVPYPPVSVLNIGYHRDDVGHSLEGIGLLVPEAEDAFHILGTIFSSSLFPNRAPDDHVLLTSFVGGMRNGALGTKSTKELLSTVQQDLDALLDLQGEPSFVHRVRLENALPQYTLDHGDVLSSLQTLEEEHAGLFFAGNYRSGISVGSAMASGARAARRIGA